jgi:fatty-acyl-CoA synthase
MGGPADSLKQLTDIANPKILKRLMQAGVVNPRSSLALMKTFPWLLGRGPSLGILSQANAYALGDKPAIHDRDGTFTFAELEMRANRGARLLQSFGLSGKDRVALLLRNGHEMVELALAAQKMGYVACPLNTWAKSKELEVTLESSGAKLLLYDTAHAEQVEKVAPPRLKLLFVGDPDKALEGSLSYEEKLAEHPDTAIPPLTRDRGSAQVIIHTSGTTGKPKGAARDSSAAGIGALANVIEVVPYTRDDVIFCPAPMFHSFGLMTVTFATGLGATLILPEKFDAEGSLEDIERYRATAASFVPVMLRRIVRLDDATKEKYDLSSLRILLASGSALSPDLRKAVCAVFGPVLHDLYGSTEAGWVAIAGPKDIEAHPDSVGKPVAGIDVRILDPDRKDLPIGETGEIFVKSGVMFEGYTSGDEKEAVDGYMSIGDLGHLDDDGYLYVEGRADDMVVVGGENIYPIEVEEVIQSVEGVSEASVLGIDDEEYGKILVAFYEGDTDESKVESRCKSDLASYKVPKRYVRMDELPRTSTGKVVKRELVAHLEESQS